MWRSLLDQLDWRHYQVVGVNLGPALEKGFLNQVGLDELPVIAKVSPESVLSYLLRFVPQTIVVGTDGRIESVWSGPLRGKIVQEVEQSFGVKLRGSEGR